jgi:hypothetical protein
MTTWVYACMIRRCPGANSTAPSHSRRSGAPLLLKASLQSQRGLLLHFYLKERHNIKFRRLFWSAISRDTYCISSRIMSYHYRHYAHNHLLISKASTMYKSSHDDLQRKFSSTVSTSFQTLISRHDLKFEENSSNGRHPETTHCRCVG